jgi:hypothetical protein
MHHRVAFAAQSAAGRLLAAGDRGAVYLFYSWRLIFMTFHGKPRASRDVMIHVHESPPVMLVPLFMLAVGALLAGIVFKDYFVGDTTRRSGARAVHARREQIVEEFHHVPLWVKCEPVRGHAAGLVLSPGVLHPLARRPAGQLAEDSIRPSTGSCSTNGTSTSSTTSSSSARRSGSAASWKAGRRLRHRRLRPRRHCRAGADITGRYYPAADRLSSTTTPLPC